MLVTSLKKANDNRSTEEVTVYGSSVVSLLYNYLEYNII